MWGFHWVCHCFKRMRCWATCYLVPQWLVLLKALERCIVMDALAGSWESGEAQEMTLAPPFDLLCRCHNVNCIVVNFWWTEPIQEVVRITCCLSSGGVMHSTENKQTTLFGAQVYNTSAQLQKVTDEGQATNITEKLDVPPSQNWFEIRAVLEVHSVPVPVGCCTLAGHIGCSPQMFFCQLSCSLSCRKIHCTRQFCMRLMVLD